MRGGTGPDGDWAAEPFELPPALASDLCRRLGVPWPAGVTDLDRLYRAWVSGVPTDNVAKELALAEGRVPPGDDPVAAVEHYLATGLGGTCWALVSALAGLLGAAGVPATVGLDRMVRADGLVDFHSFVVAEAGGRRWVLDGNWVSGAPLPLEGGATGTHPVIATGLVDGGTRLVHWARPPGGATVRYNVLATTLDRGDVRAYCEVSARFSGLAFGQLFVRRHTETSTVALRPEPGRGLVVRERWADREEERAFTDPDEAFAAMGCTTEARRMAERAGLLTPTL